LRTTAELIGETVREIGILVTVFAPLDAAFHEGKFGLPTIVCLVLLEIAGWVMMAVGVILERSD
jgi:hypothetical protein